MAKVHHVKAAKDYPDHGIKKGDTYYKWKLSRHHAEQKSKTYPKRSQLTSSDKLARAYDAIDTLHDAVSRVDDTLNFNDYMSQFSSAIADATTELQEVADEYRESADNIRESFSESSTADECEEKADSLESTISDLESIDLNEEDLEGSLKGGQRRKELQQLLEDRRDEITGIDVEI